MTTKTTFEIGDTVDTLSPFGKMFITNSAIYYNKILPTLFDKYRTKKMVLTEKTLKIWN